MHILRNDWGSFLHILNLKGHEGWRLDPHPLLVRTEEGCTTVTEAGTRGHLAILLQKSVDPIETWRTPAEFGVSDQATAWLTRRSTWQYSIYLYCKYQDKWRSSINSLRQSSKDLRQLDIGIMSVNECHCWTSPLSQQIPQIYSTKDAGEIHVGLLYHWTAQSCLCSLPGSQPRSSLVHVLTTAQCCKRAMPFPAALLCKLPLQITHSLQPCRSKMASGSLDNGFPAPARHLHPEADGSPH